MGSHDAAARPASQKKGFAIEYIAENERPGVVQQGLVCSVCDGILRDAVQVTCGGRFCQECYQDLCKWVTLRGSLVLAAIVGKTNLVPYHYYKSLLLTSWWRHQMETFSALLTLGGGGGGYSPVTGEFSSQRLVTRSFDVFFDLRLNKRLNKPTWGWWFETPSRSLWRQGNVKFKISSIGTQI